MHNSPHPGEFIVAVYLERHGITGRELASRLGVSPSTLNRVLTGKSGISPEMALRLSKCLGRSAESWLAMQQGYDLWQARKRIDLREVEQLKSGAATNSSQRNGGEESAPVGSRRRAAQRHR